MKLFKLGILVLAILVTNACTKKTDSKSDAARKNELLVGTDAAYAPFEVENPDQSISGFDIEVLKAIAAKVGLELRFINTPWEGLFTQLASGDRDILISAITINEARKKDMDFSDPYFEAVQLIAVGKKSTVTKLADLKKLKVGVQTGTTGDDVASRLLGKTNPNVKRFEGTPLAIQELQNGGVDAVVADNGVVNNFLANNAQEFKVISDSSLAKEYYGIAVKKGNSELLGKINKGLAEIKADGTYDKIYESFFGATKKD